MGRSQADRGPRRLKKIPNGLPTSRIHTEREDAVSMEVDEDEECNMANARATYIDFLRKNNRGGEVDSFPDPENSETMDAVDRQYAFSFLRAVLANKDNLERFPTYNVYETAVKKGVYIPDGEL